MCLLVIEVVTGEYGNFTSQLKTAAIDNAWRTPHQTTDSRNINYLYFFYLYTECTEFISIVVPEVHLKWKLHFFINLFFEIYVLIICQLFVQF